MKKFVIFILGFLCFFVSQILLRIPLLNYLNGSVGFGMFSIKYPVLVAFGVLLSASLFEEGFRFLYRLFLFRDDKRGEKGLISFDNSFSDAIIFGLGHGLCEVVMVLFVAGLHLSLENYILIFLERFLAVVFHICQTVLVFKGFIVNKRLAYLLLAIILHTVFNSVIFLKTAVGYIGIYIIFALIDFIFAIIILKNKKIFLEVENEKD